MIEEYQQLISEAKSKRKQIKRTLKRLSGLGTKKANALVAKLEPDVLREIDCLKCANCCSTTSPIFRDVDIRRIAKRLNRKESEFVEEHLQLDPDDGFYALKSSPCLFLQEDKKCSIYENRPLACAEFPHTDHKNFLSIKLITEKNSRICPIVAQLMFRLNEEVN